MKEHDCNVTYRGVRLGSSIESSSSTVLSQEDIRQKRIRKFKQKKKDNNQKKNAFE